MRWWGGVSAHVFTFRCLRKVSTHWGAACDGTYLQAITERERSVRGFASPARALLLDVHRTRNSIFGVDFERGFIPSVLLLHICCMFENAVHSSREFHAVPKKYLNIRSPVRRFPLCCCFLVAYPSASKLVGLIKDRNSKKLNALFVSHELFHFFNIVAKLNKLVFFSVQPKNRHEFDLMKKIHSHYFSCRCSVRWTSSRFPSLFSTQVTSTMAIRQKSRGIRSCVSTDIAEFTVRS